MSVPWCHRMATVYVRCACVCACVFGELARAHVPLTTVIEFQMMLNNIGRCIPICCDTSASAPIPMVGTDEITTIAAVVDASLLLLFAESSEIRNSRENLSSVLLLPRFLCRTRCYRSFFLFMHFSGHHWKSRCERSIARLSESFAIWIGYEVINPKLTAEIN